jgi:DNA-binding response OmpR family regulator
MLTIMVIEEDIAMRELIREWLVDEGYVVRTPSAAAGTRDIDLVILNVLNLPGQDTARLREVKTMYPRSALIGISTQLGRTLARNSDAARALGVSRLVAKPCTRGELLDAVAGTIGTAPAA